MAYMHLAGPESLALKFGAVARDRHVHSHLAEYVRPLLQFMWC